MNPRFRFAPAAARVLATALLLVLGAPAVLAATITGVVRNEAGTGLANIDLDFLNQCSGDNVFLASDKTAADGTFSVVVAAGTYDVHFTPPAGATVCAGDLQDFVVTASASLGTVTLHPGRLVSGTVRTPSLGAAAGVDLKFTDAATGVRVFLSKDVTNASGQYAVRVPPGTWNVDFRPPSGNTWVDAEREGLVVAGADVSGLADTLRSGFVVSGTVKDRHNNNLKNVDVDAFDECTGQRIATAHDNTDVNGNYAIVVPAGTYTFEWSPPACMSVEAARTAGLVVDRTHGNGTEQLGDAIAVTGVVHGSNGLPLDGARIKFYDITTAGAPRQPAAHDHTDATGAFRIVVPAGTYDLNVEPPAGVDDLVGHVDAVAAGAAVGTLTLAAGIPVHGHLAAPAGVSPLHTNVNVVDTATRTAQRLAHDDVDANGDFTVVLPPGTWDFQFAPPVCSGLAPASMANVPVGGETTLPSFPVVTGVHALGTVLDAGGLPAASVDLDVYAAGSATKLYTPNDQTTATGAYDVIVPPGSYDVKYVPSAATRQRPFARDGVALAASTTLPVTTLADGWWVSGFVRDAATLLPVVNATVDFFAPGSAIPSWTPHHLTAADGSYRITVDPGDWNLFYQGPAGASYVPQWRNAVTVGADVALTDELLAVGTTAVGPGDPAAGDLRIWPNPAHGEVRMSIGDDRGAEVSVWDLLGRRVARISPASSFGGETLHWRAVDGSGAPLRAGVYYVRLTSPGRAGVTRRVALVR